jgi:hypothetical protein
MQLTGALTVCICSLLLGLLMCSEEKKHLAAFEEMVFLMRSIRDEIWIRRTPTEIIFSSLSSPNLEKTDFYKNLKGGKGLYFASLCCGFSPDELELIKGTLSELAPILSAEKERVKKEKTLTLTLSSAFSVGLVILLI